MLAMPTEQKEKLQKLNFAEKMEESDIEYNALEADYEKVIKRLDISSTT